MIYFIGLAIGLTLALSIYRINKITKLNKWYDWLLGVAVLVLLSMGIQHLSASLSGFEPTAAWMGSVIFIGLALILAGVEWRLLSSRRGT